MAGMLIHWAMEVAEMYELDATKRAGEVLRQLIQQNYSSQEEFAQDFGMDVRTVSRYVNNGINKISLLQELAAFFRVSILDFLKTEE